MGGRTRIFKSLFIKKKFRKRLSKKPLKDVSSPSYTPNLKYSFFDLVNFFTINLLIFKSSEKFSKLTYI